MIRKELIEYINIQDEKDFVFLFISSLRHPELNSQMNISPKTVFKLIEDNIISKDYITSKYQLLIPYYETDIGSNIPQNNYKDIYTEISQNIDLYRSLFKGFRVGSMGNKNDCINKMVDFVINHNTTLDEVCRATLWYLERENPDYVMNADNFIANEKGSKLAIVMEELPTSRLI